MSWAGAQGIERRATRHSILLVMVLVAALAALALAAPHGASAAEGDGVTCGSMSIGSTPFKQVSVRGGTCADARSLIRAYRTKTLGCRTQSTYELVRVRCGRYKGMVSKVVKFGDPWSANGSHLLLSYKGMRVDAHPRLVKVPLNGKASTPKTGGRAAAPSLRFGTANGLMGMQAEHEMITRAALSCTESSTPQGLSVTVQGVNDAVVNCFEPRSIDNLAGYGSWTTRDGLSLISYGAAYIGSGFGAVGAADNMAMRMMRGGPDWWHCDGADYLPNTQNGGVTYPTTINAARSQLAWCHDFANMMMNSRLSGAYAEGCGVLITSSLADGWLNPCVGLVPMAANLTGSDGMVVAGMELTSACSFDGGQKTTPAYAKCSALEPLGYVLHAAEDFYSHSNFSDASEPGKPISIANPPGFATSLPPLPPLMEQRVPANYLPAFWDLSGNQQITDISANIFGQDAGVFERMAPWPITGCYPDSSCAGRVTHTNLTKDLSGGIDYTKGALATIGAPGNPRGAASDNTLRAVRLAILEVRRQWEVAQQMLKKKYGEQQGGMMICALTRDNPTTCNA